jgi:uncharacterized membrane protein YeaQ/YmgE (transglycosylase-associated protein family)
VSIIVWLIVGLIAGIAMGDRGFGVLGNIFVGSIGAIIGGFPASTFIGLDLTGFNLPSILVAFVGSMVFLLILRAVPDPSHSNDSVHLRSGPFTKAADPLGHCLRSSAIAPKSRTEGTRHPLHLDIDGKQRSG